MGEEKANSALDYIKKLLNPVDTVLKKILKLVINAEVGYLVLALFAISMFADISIQDLIGEGDAYETCADKNLTELGDGCYNVSVLEEDTVNYIQRNGPTTEENLKYLYGTQGWELDEVIEKLRQERVLVTYMINGETHYYLDRTNYNVTRIEEFNRTEVTG